MPYSPILLIAFNRPELVELSLASLVNLGVREIWVHLDAPRTNSESDEDAVLVCKRIVESYRAKFDQIHLRTANTNLGCKFGPISAIDWFFSFVESGVILEDDVRVSKEFLEFVEFGLEEHMSNVDVWAINGWSPFSADELTVNGWLSRYPAPWGWATWKNRWVRSNFSQHYDPTLRTSDLKTIAGSKTSVDFEMYWNLAFASVRNGFDAWDYEWFHEIWWNGGLVVAPPSRLTSNIGFNQASTHTNSPVGRAGFPISIGKNFIMKSTLAPNLELDLALDKMMFGMQYPSEEIVNLKPFLNPAFSKQLERILIRKYSFTLFLRSTYLVLSNIPGFKRSFGYLFKILSKSPLLSKAVTSYRSRVWFT